MAATASYGQAITGGQKAAGRVGRFQLSAHGSTRSCSQARATTRVDGKMERLETQNKFCSKEC